MTKLLLVRHGETDWNRERRVQGWSDPPLNETGREQARQLASVLEAEPVDAVYSSDLDRAVETARIVAARKGLPVQALPGLREKHFGSWEGLTDEEIRERFPEALAGHWGDGETTDEMTGRFFAALEEIALAHPGERVLVVSHGGPIRAVLRGCGADGAGPIPNCHLTRLESRDGVLRPVD